MYCLLRSVHASREVVKVVYSRGEVLKWSSSTRPGGPYVLWRNEQLHRYEQAPAHKPASPRRSPLRHAPAASAVSSARALRTLCGGWGSRRVLGLMAKGHSREFPVRVLCRYKGAGCCRRVGFSGCNVNDMKFFGCHMSLRMSFPHSHIATPSKARVFSPACEINI